MLSELTRNILVSVVSKAESFKIHGRRHMLVIVSTYREARLNESVADHKSDKTFCLNPIRSRGVFREASIFLP